MVFKKKKTKKNMLFQEIHKVSDSRYLNLIHLSVEDGIINNGTDKDDFYEPRVFHGNFISIMFVELIGHKEVKERKKSFRYGRVQENIQIPPRIPEEMSSEITKFVNVVYVDNSFEARIIGVDQYETEGADTMSIFVQNYLTVQSSMAVNVLYPISDNDYDHVNIFV